VSIAERVTWKQAMARHLLDSFQLDRVDPLPPWKVEELVTPMNLRLQVLLARGITSAAAIEQHFFDRSEDHRNDYATGQ